MSYTLTQTINYAQPFFDYQPITAGLGQEPAVSVASMIRGAILAAPFTWAWNRKEDSTTITSAGVQDYTIALTDFGFLEKVSAQLYGAITNVVGSGTVATITANNGFSVGQTVVVAGLTHTAFNGTFTITAATPTTFSFASATVQVSVGDTGTAVADALYEIKDVFNSAALASATYPLARPNSVCIILSTPGTSIKLRLMSVPDTIYKITVTYQVAAPISGPFLVTAAGNHSGANTSYTGTFNPTSFPAGSFASISGFVTNAVNNGSFVVVSCNATTLVVANGAGIAESVSAFASNFSWDPLPDQFNYIYNTLFLGEMFAVTDDARAQLYRQRGVGALLSKAEGLSETQRNAFAQQWLARGAESAAAMMRVQQGNQGRAV